MRTAASGTRGLLLAIACAAALTLAAVALAWPARGAAPPERQGPAPAKRQGPAEQAPAAPEPLPVGGGAPGAFTPA